MKILAIRGKNLASLAGEFEIDFQLQPLASAGLFAISGPTGAGKSTLLDALCLALYDKTPRLQQAGSQGVYLQDVGKETLPPHDVRNLLRRGCAEGYAEVDFIGNDQQHYRSRWSVRRAHGKADRKLKASEMQLIRLADQQIISAMKTEVKDEIRQRLGLNFDQFTRAVLLAQNEFSVFLKAPDDERAGLLETLTGTDQYSQISIRAFERAKLEKNALELLQTQLSHQHPLDIADRQALEIRKQAVTLDLNSHTQHKAAVESHIQWHRQYQALQAAENDALVRLEQNQREDAQSQARRKQLALLESLQEARSMLADFDRLSQECTQSKATLAQAETALTSARTAEKAALEHRQQSQQQLDQVEQQKTIALPDMVKARTLDTEITTLTPSYRQQQEGLVTAQQSWQKANIELENKRNAKNNAAATLEKTQHWLDRHADLEMLSKQWSRWDMLFGHAKDSITQINTDNTILAKAQAKLLVDNNDVQAVQVQLEQIQESFSKAEQSYQSAAHAAGFFDAEALTSANSSIQQRLDQLRNTKSIWKTLQSLQDQHATHSEKLHHLMQQHQQQTLMLASYRLSLPPLIARHEQAAKMQEMAKMACSESVEKLRGTLQDDNECPVCGSKQHPFADGHHPFRTELAILEQEVTACLNQRKQAEQQENRASLEIEIFDKQSTELKLTLEDLACDIKQQQALWYAQGIVAELEQHLEPAYSEWLNQQLTQSETQQLKITGALKAMADANTQLTAARQTLDSLTDQQSAARQRFNSAATALREGELQLANATERQQAAKNQLNRQLTDLDAAFSTADWRQQWLAAPEEYYRHYADQAKTWQHQQDQQQQLRAAMAILDTELSALSDNLQQATDIVTTAKNLFLAVELALVGKQHARTELFAGRSISDIETQLEQSVANAKNHLQETLAKATASQTRLASCQEAYKQTSSLLSTRLAQLADAEHVVQVWLSAFNQPIDTANRIDLPQLRQWLERDSIWISKERLALEALGDALKQAQTVVNERRQQCAAHLQTRASLDPLDDLSLKLITLNTELSTLQNQLTELELQLRSDDERLKLGAELQGKIESQATVSDTWSKLSALLGSADGKKFRNIAQQLTLDILLSYANQHLKDLSRRYRLERVKDTLALQVVDQDMGDEIRSVHSLSGGESFLLSLALALGLASLSSNRVRVESLFIDEGFGSLDADTLRVAMDALDSLQALGRKVGVISHVQEMTERIGTRIQVSRGSGGVSKIIVCGI